MCITTGTDLDYKFEKVKEKIEELRKDNPLIFAAAYPLIRDLMEWMESVNCHIRKIENKDFVKNGLPEDMCVNGKK